MMQSTVRQKIFRWVVGCILLTGAGALAGAPGPANDDFANAELLVGEITSTTGDNTNATAEVSEPIHGGSVATRSVWYTWVAPVSASVTFDTEGSSFDTVMGVYTGSSVSTLTELGSNDDSLTFPPQSEVEVSVTAGHTYYIAVDGFSGEQGGISFQISTPPSPPVNDDFSGSIVLAGLPVSDTGSNVTASAEGASEPNHAGQTADESVWWSWTSTITEDVTVSLAGSSFDTILGVYTGATLSGLVEIGSNNDDGTNITSRVQFAAVTGETYHFAVDGNGTADGDISIGLTESNPAPANDDFANRATLSGLPATVVSNNINASFEAGEPDHNAETAFASVWWTWTPASSGNVEINTTGSDFNTTLAVYTGTEVTNLTEVAANGDFGTNETSRVEFSVLAGTAYQIAVDGFDEAEGNITLNIVAGPSGPANDDFANAIVLAGFPASDSGSNHNATVEAGEPDHDPIASGGRSVWWQWTAPTTLVFSVDTFGSSPSTFDTHLAVYTGATVSTLGQIAQNDASAPTTELSRVTFLAELGVTYYFAVDGQNMEEGDIALNITLAPQPPPNDDFENSAVISSLSSAVTGSNLHASVQSGEPVHAGVASSNSVWWSWVATVESDISASTVGSTFDTILGVYTGLAVNALTEIASNNDSGGTNTSETSFSSVIGQTYYFAVDGANSETGDISLVLVDLDPRPVNDHFNNRSLIVGLPTSVIGSNINATSEANEPDHNLESAGASVWWTWTAPSSGNVEINTIGSDFDTDLAIYTGSVLSNLTEVVADGDAGGGVGTSLVEFNAFAGTVYQIAVDGFDEEEGNIVLNIVAGPPGPVNDNFVDAISISGLPVSTSGSNVNATIEIGEPDHDPVAGKEKSVWWSWTSPTSGVVVVDTFGSDFDTLLAVYTGGSVGSLTQIAQNNKASVVVDQSRLSFIATQGVTYYFAVDGQNSDEGDIDLNLDLIVDPQITASMINGGTDFSLQWSSASGEDYDVFQSTNLVDWVVYTNILATSTVTNVMAPIQSEKSVNFYYVGTAVDG